VNITGAKTIRARRTSRFHAILMPIFILTLVAVLSQIPAASAFAQQQPPEQPSQPSSEQKKAVNQADSPHTSFGRELAEETNEATGAEKEENANLKYSGTVRLLARVTGLNIRQAHWLALGINFAIIVAVIVWAGRKYLPSLFRNRTEAIQQALAEARAASEDANRRLADIEARLRQMDVEIEKMQSAAEKEADAEAERIRKTTEEDMRKVVLAAEHEIAAAAKQARRELSAHTADLAISLARKQINVDSNTDQVLVRTFASHLTPNDSSHTNDSGGKDGR
jgi:F-type H+-transporting ATPase subunit b